MVSRLSHSMSFLKEKPKACESFPVKVLWSVEKNAAMDVISLIGAPLTCLPFTTQFHSLWANQVRMINSTCNTKCENSCPNPLTFSVKSGHQSFCVQGDLHLFKPSTFLFLLIFTSFVLVARGVVCVVYLLFRLANYDKLCKRYRSPPARVDRL